MKNHLVTVVIPTYNAGIFLRPAVDSILGQTYQELEIIIVDDGSTDASLATISDIRDERIQILRQANQGKAAAVNRALDQMKGEFWIVQDADDLSHPERVERQLATMNARPDVAAVFLCVELLVNDVSFAPQIIGKSAEECRRDIERLQMPAHDATGMYRVSMIHNYRIDPELRIGEGFDLIMRVGENYPIMVIDGCLYSHRLNLSSLTHRDPRFNVEQINLATKKACERRGLTYEKHKAKLPKKRRHFKHRDFDTVVSYAVLSVRQHKQAGSFWEALRTAIFSARMHPMDPLYYKPLLLLMTPISALGYYRWMRDAVKNVGTRSKRK